MQQNIAEETKARVEFLERLAKHTCDCRLHSDVEPLDMDAHSHDCEYRFIVTGERP